MNGNITWLKQYDRGCGNDEYGEAIDKCSTSGFILTGMESCSFLNIWLLRTDNNGDTLWTKNFVWSGTKEVHSIKKTFDGGFQILKNINASGQ